MSRRLSMCSILKKKTISHIEWLRIYQTHIALFVTIRDHNAMNYNKRLDKVLGIKVRNLILKCTTNSVPEAILKQSRDQDHCVTMPGGGAGTRICGAPQKQSYLRRLAAGPVESGDGGRRLVSTSRKS